MGLKIRRQDFNNVIQNLSKEYKVYAPVTLVGKGNFSDTDSIRYEEVKDGEKINLVDKSHFSYKEVILPTTQTLFYFTEDQWMEPKIDDKKILVFLRSCDMHGVKRVDQIYLKNGAEDPYYKALREKVKFILIGCENSFENCFCASMGTNKTNDYDMAVNDKGDYIEIDIKDNNLSVYFEGAEGEASDITPAYVEDNDINVNIPDGNKIDLGEVTKLPLWNEYNARCIACGKCNFVCPTCTCNSMQDIFYRDNKNAGERRRVWASCQVDGYTTMAGGHGFRQDKGQRMRFKVLHKVYDFNKRFGYHMCVGCGRCDDACPQYISFSNCVNKLTDALEGGKAHE
ncbi:anaerobic sulfite reductase subunit AsrA [Clostridium peptidivorans]|uniref:anaerobic sulfite reductase subunit AsrA n=1 Tax=Clostridium peptidivorans TaxID=100174 RepID=UPI000BE2C7E2|nr:anaerobic sulfite reductase subunit AsrA [Clostridium peptidivorans]